MRKSIKAQLSLQSQAQCIPEHKLNKELSRMDKILSRHPEFVDWVHFDLTDGKASTGNSGMSSEQVLRAAILKNIRKLTYEQLSYGLIDTHSASFFLKLEDSERYSSSCLQDNISKVTEETWEKISQVLVLDGKDQGLEDLKAVRVDSTVTDTHIGYPTDSKLLYDCIRVLNRNFKEVRRLSDKPSWRLTSNGQVKEVKKLRYKINYAKNSDSRLPHYQALLKISESLSKALPAMIAKIEKVYEKRKNNSRIGKQLESIKNIEFFLNKIIDQTEKRVIKKQRLPSDQKVVSIFEPHTDIIVKDRRETQFGHKIFISSGKSGMVLQCDIPKGNPSDSEMFLPGLTSIKEAYGVVPRKISADGGFASKDNVFKSKDLGVKDVCFPKTCNMEITDMVKSTQVYEQLIKWRAGIEGVISFLKRCFGLGRSNWSGFKGFKQYVRCGIATFNLLKLARLEISAASTA